jgi:hypothetical protein
MAAALLELEPALVGLLDGKVAMGELTNIEIQSINDMFNVRQWDLSRGALLDVIHSYLDRSPNPNRWLGGSRPTIRPIGGSAAVNVNIDRQIQNIGQRNPQVNPDEIRQIINLFGMDNMDSINESVDRLNKSRNILNLGEEHKIDINEEDEEDIDLNDEADSFLIKENAGRARQRLPGLNISRGAMKKIIKIVSGVAIAAGITSPILAPYIAAGERHEAQTIKKEPPTGTTPIVPQVPLKPPEKRVTINTPVSDEGLTENQPTGGPIQQGPRQRPTGPFQPKGTSGTGMPSGTPPPVIPVLTPPTGPKYTTPEYTIGQPTQDAGPTTLPPTPPTPTLPIPISTPPTPTPTPPQNVYGKLLNELPFQNFGDIPSSGGGGYGSYKVGSFRKN